MTLIKVKSRGTDNVSGRRNMVINGAMNVAQRGTSHASVSNNAYTLDRFAFTYSQDGAFTVTQDSSSPDGFANSLKLDVTTADSSLAASQYLIMEHKIEAQNLHHLHFGKSSAKNITLSFYVKSNKTGTYGVTIIQGDNSSKMANLTYTIDSADTWEQKSLTFTGDTSGVINDDNGIGLKLGFTLAVGSTWTSGDTSASFRTFANGNYGGGQTVNILDSTSNEWFITGVQLEVGDSASDFEHRYFAEELQLCQRYFFQEDTNADNIGGRMGIASGTVNVTIPYDMPVQMRAKPSLSLTNANIRCGDMVTAGFNTSSGTVNANSYLGSKNVTLVLGGFTGLTNYRTYLHEPRTSDGSIGIIKFDAEL